MGCDCQLVIKENDDDEHCYLCRHIGQGRVAGSVNERREKGRLERRLVETRERQTGVGRLELGRRQIPSQHVSTASHVTNSLES